MRVLVRQEARPRADELCSVFFLCPVAGELAESFVAARSPLLQMKICQVFGGAAKAQSFHALLFHQDVLIRSLYQHYLR
jgi:hypothetical protein